MDIEFDYKGDPLGGVITNCKYYICSRNLGTSPRITFDVELCYRNNLEIVIDGQVSNH